MYKKHDRDLHPNNKRKSKTMCTFSDATKIDIDETTRKYCFKYFSRSIKIGINNWKDEQGCA